MVNFAASALFLLGAGLLCGQSCSAARLVLGSCAGAAASLALLWPELPFVPALLYKVSSCAAMVALAYGCVGARRFARLCAWVLLLSLTLTGAVLLPDLGAHCNNFSVYLPLSPALLLACCGAVYAVLRAMLLLFGRGADRCVDAELELDGARISVRAFYDTGFSLSDAATGRAVVLLRYEAVREELSAPLRAYLDAELGGSASLPAPALGVRLIPCGTVAGRCLLPAVPARTLTRRVGGKMLCQSGLLAVFASGLPMADWTLIFGSDVAANLGL